MLFTGFKNRRVLVTGDTGFKGSWLCRWLQMLGADVCGVGLPPLTVPNAFTELKLDHSLRRHTVDIRDHQALSEVVRVEQPDVVLHLAAQALVRPSYESPRETFEVNVSGVVNLLEAVRQTPSVRACVVVTSDKCYENQEWDWGYRERDPLGGHDPYSASKGAAEIVTASYRRSFFGDRNGTQVATARAGNVIGGGDWSADRIVVDLVKSLQEGRPLELRNPGAVRPWQHVLEPLSGYLRLADALLGDDGHRYADAWNFGPDAHATTTVLELANKMIERWGDGRVVCSPNANQPHEAKLLSLDCSLAASRLGWSPAWTVQQAIDATTEWYQAFYRGGADMLSETDRQIAAYEADSHAKQHPARTLPARAA